MQKEGENKDVKEPKVQDKEHGKHRVPHKDRLWNPRQKRRLRQSPEEVHIIPGASRFFFICHNVSPSKEKPCSEFRDHGCCPHAKTDTANALNSALCDPILEVHGN